MSRYCCVGCPGHTMACGVCPRCDHHNSANLHHTSCPAFYAPRTSQPHPGCECHQPQSKCHSYVLNYNGPLYVKDPGPRCSRCPSCRQPITAPPNPHCQHLPAAAAAAAHYPHGGGGGGGGAPALDPQDTLIYGRRPEDYCYHRHPVASRYFTDTNGVVWRPTLPEGVQSFRHADRDCPRSQMNGGGGGGGGGGAGAVGTGGERRAPCQ